MAWQGWVGPASAQTGPGPTIGPWIFASVALLLVAWLAWRAGRKDALSNRPDRAKSAPARGSGDDGGSRTLAALCDDLGGTILVCRRATDGRDWQVAAAHPAIPEGRTGLDSVPASVVFTARNLAPGTSVDVEGWHLHVTGAGTDERLVLRQLPPAPPGEDAATFSFTLSHDLRAPVRVVEGFARILKEDYGRLLDRIGNDHLDRVLGAAARMNAMIDAMLSLARLSSQPIARQPVNLSQLASFVIDDLRRAHPDRAVSATVAQGLHAVGDPTLLRQVVENLLSNAWKYTARCESAEVSFTAAPRDGRQVFEVRDNGAGFDMRSAERLFGLFQRLHSANEFPGTGVGLASVQRIVRRHGGDIWVEAEPGRGACFYFTLPG